MEKLKLYIFQAPRTIHVNWEYPPPGKASWDGYRKSGYYHPDVDIYIARARCVRSYNYDLIGYHIMLALQDAHMPVNALRRDRKERKEVKKGSPQMKSMRMWPSE